MPSIPRIELEDLIGDFDRCFASGGEYWSWDALWVVCLWIGRRTYTEAELRDWVAGCERRVLSDDDRWGLAAFQYTDGLRPAAFKQLESARGVTEETVKSLVCWRVLEPVMHLPSWVAFRAEKPLKEDVLNENRSKQPRPEAVWGLDIGRFEGLVSGCHGVADLVKMFSPVGGEMVFQIVSYEAKTNREDLDKALGQGRTAVRKSLQTLKAGWESLAQGSGLVDYAGPMMLVASAGTCFQLEVMGIKSDGTQVSETVVACTDVSEFANRFRVVRALCDFARWQLTQHLPALIKRVVDAA